MKNAPVNDRKSYWEAGGHETSVLIVGDTPVDFEGYIKKVTRGKDKKDTGELLKSAYMTCKELIFDFGENGGYTLDFICWVLNADLKLGPKAVLQAIYKSDDEETIKRDLAIAFTYEVPVVPNTQKVAPKLESLFAELFSTGFSMGAKDNSKRYVIDDAFKFKLDDSMDYMSRYFQPSEISGLIKELRDQTEQNVKVKALLARITAATNELQQLLVASDRNENAIQDCLTRYPILFGIEYVKVIPKYKLGKEYETDYALQMADGQVDVMEIEASTHLLYTKAGNPTKHLTHAEQQIMDWLAWLDTNSPYARQDFPGIRRAKGLVVIGKRSDLTGKDVESLKWRNMMFGDRIRLLTFDDLLDKAELLKRILTHSDPETV